MNIIENTLHSLQQINPNSLQTALKAHLNQQATALANLYTLTYPQDRSFKLESQIVGRVCALTLAFSYAPTQVCSVLVQALKDLPASSQLAVLNPENNSALFKIIMFKAPVVIRQEVLTIIASWPLELRKTFFLNNLSDFLSWVNKDDETSALTLLSFLKPFESKQIVAIFKKEGLFPAYDGLITFFKLNPSDAIALYLLELIDPLDVKLLSKLFFPPKQIETKPLTLFHAGIMLNSPPVLTKLFTLFKKLPDKEKKQLLLEEAELNKTSTQTLLELLFSEEAYLPLTSSVIRELAPYPQLFSLLAKKNSRHLAPLESAIRLSNRQGLKIYLEQANSSINDFKGLVLEFNLSELLQLEQAQPLLELISQQHIPLALRQKKLNELKPLLKAELLNVRLVNNQTLIQRAAALGDKLIVEALLAHGADPSLVDDEQKNALDEAIEQEQVNVIGSLIHHKSVAFQLHSPKANLLLKLLFKHKQLALLRDLWETFSPALNSCPEQFLPQALELFSPLPRLRLDVEKIAALSTFATSLESFAIKEQEPTLYFFLELIKFISKHPKLTALSAQSFLKNNLSLLSQGEKFLEKEQLQLWLKIFLFALPTHNMLALISSLQLTISEKIQLDLLLCQGLVQPLLFSKLTLREHQLIHASFSNKKMALESLANIYFLRTELGLLQPELLLYFAKELSLEKMSMYAEKRIHATLFILALEKALTEGNSIQSDSLFEKLRQELLLFKADRNRYSLAELRLMLNIACHKEVKHFLSRYFKESPAFLEEPLYGLFKDFHQERLLIPNSWLSDWYNECAHDLISIQKNESFSSLSCFLEKTDLPNFYSILSSYENNYLILTKASNYLKTNTLVKDSDYTFMQWLVQLEEKIRRSACVPALDLLKHSQALIPKLIIMLKNGSKPLAQALAQLKTEKTKCSTQLLHLMSNSRERLDPSMETRLNTLITAYENVKKTLNTAQLELKDSSPPVFKLITSLLSAQANFPAELKALCSELDEQQKKINLQQAAIFTSIDKKTSLNELFLKPASALNPLIEKEASDFRDFALQQSAQLSRTFVKALLSHADDETLWEQLLTKQFFGDLTYLLKKWPMLLERFSPRAWAKIDNHLDKLIDSYSQAQPILNDLRMLSFSPEFKIADLLELLDKVDEKGLANFEKLTHQTNCSELNIIITAKASQLPFEEGLATQSINQLNLANWLEDSLEKITNYSSVCLSLKALKLGLYKPQSENSLKAFNHLLETSPVDLKADIALLILNSYQSTLEADLLSLESQQCIESAATLFKHSSLSLQSELVQKINPPFLSLLLSHCLIGMTSNDLKRAQDCKSLLASFSHLAVENNLQFVKEHLGQQDLTLLNTSHLQQIAQEILQAKTEELQELTVNGVWIQRLLTSPIFIGKASKETISLLVERYRLLSLALTQDEFERLNDWNKEKLVFATHHRQSMERLKQEILANPKRRAQLLEKSKQLRAFRVEDSIRALFNQLEDNCTSLSTTDKSTADAALEQLYGYYNQQLGSLRSDLLFKVADFIYNKACRQKGDLERLQSTLFQWLEHYLPHKNFEQMELARKQKVIIYNQEGKKIGFINEMNQAMTFVDDLPCSLVEQKGYTTGMKVYDDHRQLMGTLTRGGRLKPDNIFQQQTAALLLANVPLPELSQSPGAIALLVEDIFHENTVDLLYDNENSPVDSNKRDWLQIQLNNHIVKTKKVISPETLKTVIKHQAPASVLSLLNHTKQNLNAQAIFDGILENNDLQGLIFKGDGKEFNHYLKQVGAKEALAHYLIQHHHQPWFNQGLELFANHAEHSKQVNLLNEALVYLGEQAQNAQVYADCCDKVIDILLTKEESATLVLRMCGDKNQPIQTGSNAALDHFTSMFTKDQLVAALKVANEKKEPQSKVYRLLLASFAAHHQTIFMEKEYRFSKKLAWQAEDLQQLTTFLLRHLKQGKTLDEELKIGYKLLSELTFRTANFGQSELFYEENGAFNIKLASSTLKRSLFSAVASKFFLPATFKNADAGVFSNIKNWLKKDASEQLELDSHQPLIDWKQLANETWPIANSSTQLPVICAYLFNYSGSPIPLIKLLDDYIAAQQDDKKLQGLHKLTQLMAGFPERDVSAFIFAAVEKALLTRPTLVDAKVLGHLATFHYQRHLKASEKLTVMDQKLALLKHFGQQRFYGLVHRCCFLLQPNKQKSILKAKIRLISRESVVEACLQGYVGKWFFSSARFFKRWWNYGSKCSQLVKYCDNTENYTQYKALPSWVNSTVEGGTELGKKVENYKQTKELKKRFDNFINKNKAPSTSIFKENNVAKQPEKELAAVANFTC